MNSEAFTFQVPAKFFKPGYIIPPYGTLVNLALYVKTDSEGRYFVESVTGEIMQLAGNLSPNRSRLTLRSKTYGFRLPPDLNLTIIKPPILTNY